MYRDVFPHLIKQGLAPSALVSGGQYRNSDADASESQKFDRLWVPKIFRGKRRICAILYWISALWVLLTMPRANLVFLSQPPIFYVFGSWIAKTRKMPYCLHVMDLYPDLFKKSNILSNGLIYKLLERAAITAFKNANQIIVIGRCMQKVIRDKGIDPDKVKMIANWPDKIIAENQTSGQAFRNKYKLDDKFVVMYAGNMGRFHIFETLITAASRLKKNKDMVFVFIGNGVRRRELEFAIDKGLNNLLLLDHQSVEQFGDMLAAGDVHFISLQSGLEGLMVPSKFYSVLATGKAVIYEGGSEGEVAKVISQESCGVVIPPENVDMLEFNLLEYYRLRNRAGEDGMRSKTTYLEQFDRSQLAREYARVVSKLGS